MSYVKIMVHCVWGTSHRRQLFHTDTRRVLIEHILSNAKKKNIYLDTINGYTDHLHAIVGLSAEQSISKVMGLIKGESSHWANEVGLLPTRLEWAHEYFGESVGRSDLERVRKYVANQEDHHRIVTFAEEYESFMHEIRNGSGMWLTT